MRQEEDEEEEEEEASRMLVVFSLSPSRYLGKTQPQQQCLLCSVRLPADLQ
jgi:hypothetical protein